MREAPGESGEPRVIPAGTYWTAISNPAEHSMLVTPERSGGGLPFASLLRRLANRNPAAGGRYPVFTRGGMTCHPLRRDVAIRARRDDGPTMLGSCEAEGEDGPSPRRSGFGRAGGSCNGDHELLHSSRRVFTRGAPYSMGRQNSIPKLGIPVLPATVLLRQKMMLVMNIESRPWREN